MDLFIFGIAVHYGSSSLWHFHLFRDNYFEIIPAKNYIKSRNNTSTYVLYFSEMIAPLDVYHNTAGVTVPNEERQRRYRHHRTQHKHHRHRHPGFQFDPNNAEVNFHLQRIF